MLKRWYQGKRRRMPLAMCRNTAAVLENTVSVYSLMSGVVSMMPSRCCWTLDPIILDHWPMETVVQQHLDGTTMAALALRSLKTNFSSVQVSSLRTDMFWKGDGLKQIVCSMYAFNAPSCFRWFFLFIFPTQN